MKLKNRWNLPAIIALCGSIIRSVIDVVRNEPKRVNDVPFWEYSTVTLHSRSRFCFRSRHIWNAQPTAWLNRSPESLIARKPWQSHRRVVPSRHIYAKPFSWWRSGAQKDTFSIVWSTIRPYYLTFVVLSIYFSMTLTNLICFINNSKCITRYM
jgi:hypothetical protein